ncbi:MAG: acyl carrier protein [Bacteroidia bacterium]|nr:acyl carrier protein [Bacteroidia bacterium]
MSKTRPEFDFFLENFADQFSEAEAGSIQGNTRFRDLEEWSSMQALVVNLSFDDLYGLTLTTDDYLSAQTVVDLYQLIIKKLA